MANVYQSYVGPIPPTRLIDYPALETMSTGILPTVVSTLTVSTASVTVSTGASVTNLPKWIMTSPWTEPVETQYPVAEVLRTQPLLNVPTMPGTTSVLTLSINSTTIQEMIMPKWIVEYAWPVVINPFKNEVVVSKVIAAPPTGGSGAFKAPSSGQLYPLGLQ